MSHPSVVVREFDSVVHIMVDGGPDALCDDCCCNCNDVPIGVRFGSHVVCPACAVDRLRAGDRPNEVSRPNETFKTFCDRLNAPLRARMDALTAETN